MSEELSRVVEIIEDLAPQSLAREWDKVGLQVGSYHQQVDSVLVTLDVNRQVLEEAVAADVDLIISHHPFIFTELAAINFDSPQGQLIKKAVQNEIAIYAMHSNYDIAPGGLNDLLADKLEVENTQVLQITSEQQLKKLVVFVPEEAVEEVRSALVAAGAGWIGNYSHCTFQQSGQGTFKPLAGTDPYLGTQGEVSEVAEKRIETIVPEGKLASVLEAVLEAHPYEEVAYDVYPLDNQGEVVGIGRIGRIEARSLEEYSRLVKKKLSLKTVKVVGKLDQKVEKVALCSGSGADFIKPAAAKGADLLITGDLKFHEAQAAEAEGLAVIDAGHYGTEKIMQAGVTDYLQTKAEAEELEIEVITSQTNTKPWELM